ncbi:MAG: NAD(P)/FAD-dependent oxidoreductase [Pseudomonadota bacterium]
MTELPTQSISIIGAGLGGALMALLLAKRGFQVDVYERRPDQRRHELSAGRSINLALANRGLAALDRAGLRDEVRALLTTMRGRMLHDLDGTQSLQPYGQREEEVIYSVSRPGLNILLLNAAEQHANVHLHFEHTAETIDFPRESLEVKNLQDGTMRRVDGPLIVADGASSRLRRALVEQTRASATEDFLPHDYKELTIPPSPDGGYRLDAGALHIWPRGGFMLIALPNKDGSFTATLFAPREGEHSFAELASDEEVTGYFQRHFASVVPHLPQLVEEFADNPQGQMVTVHCTPWHWRGFAVMLGDASHAIVPFHGQGMNAAFEDCAALDVLLGEAIDEAGGQIGQLPWADVFSRFELARKPNADAIAQMAVENYVEMRDAVRDPLFHQRKAVAFELERRYPEVFIPRYSMVMFHLLPYAHALARGRCQQEILEQLVPSVDYGEVDWSLADRLVRERLAPLVGELAG